MVQQARFIAFEGGEGAGKTTIMRRLEGFLADERVPALFTREPGGTPEGRELRQMLLTGETGRWSAEAETLLMLADRIQHIHKVIRPSLAEGRHVISDRYVFSTLAYQGAARGVSRKLVLDLHRDLCGDLWPDLTVVLDVDPAVGLARSERRMAAAASTEDRFEKFGLTFHETVRAAFRDLAMEYPERAVLIDTARPLDEVCQSVQAALSPLLT